MLLPAMFFLSVAMEQILHNSFLMDGIFVPIDKTSGMLSAFIMVGLPFIALCINIVPMLFFDIKRETDALRIIFEIKAKKFNLFIACLGLLTIIIILGYLFTENFMMK